MAEQALALKAPPQSNQNWKALFSANIVDLIVPVAVLAIIIALITPMPALLLDFLLATDIMLSIVVLMVSVYISKPVEFTVFPTTLLMLTLFRLALNVSSSRLILLNGNTGTSAAGEVISSFGQFVVGGNYIVGVVIFLILIAIQYVVINHGAVRISEVTARFTLDALPGKQMSIDADLNAGSIDELEARQRRKALAAEAEFYGAMDGASRFTQRDAMASILITSINIIAGFLIGVLQHDMDLKRAIQTYTILTIGDGLVTVVPALMISVSGAMVVTRASSEDRLGKDFRTQLFNAYQPLLLAGVVLVALAALPGLPKLPFLAVGGGIGSYAWYQKNRRKTVATDENRATEHGRPAQKEKENIENLLRVEPLAIEVGLGLVKLVEGGQDSPLLKRVAGIRRQLATDLGYMLPPLKLTDNLSMEAHKYAILIKGVQISSFELPPGCELAISVGKVQQQISGSPTKEPAFGIPALWINTSVTDQAKRAGYTVVDPVTVMGTHIAEFVRRHAHELFSRQDTKKFLDRIAAEQPKLVEDLVPKVLSTGTLQRVLQNLLREQVSIRDSGTILEALGEAALTTRNPVLLTEFVRQSIRRAVVKPYLNRQGDLPAYFIDTTIERALELKLEHGEQNGHLAASPEMIRDVLARFEQTIQKPEGPVVVLASSSVRFFMRQLAEGVSPNLVFISHNEVPSEVRVVNLGTSINPMRIKSYFAPSVQAAISLARKEFGEGVTLVTSHVAAAESRDLGEYEVVFAIEESTDSAAAEQALPVPGQTQDKFQEVLAQAIAAPASPQLNLPEKLEQLRSLFVEIGIDPTMVRALMTMVERCVPVPQLPAAEMDALLTASRVPAPAANAQAASLTVPVLSAAASGPAADPKEESPSPAAKPKHSAAELAFLTSVSEPSKTPPPSLPDWRFGL